MLQEREGQARFAVHGEEVFLIENVGLTAGPGNRTLFGAALNIL
jgi:hypothetical protein